MKVNKILLMALSSSLIACSGVDGIVTGIATSTATALGSAVTASLASSSGSLLAIKADGGTSEIAIKSVSDINKVMLDGKTLTLIPAGLSAGGFLTILSPGGVNGDGVSRIVSGSRYSYNRFGLLMKTGQDTKIIFGQGMPTTDMPTTGQVKYAGDYVLYNEKTGKVDFTADFAKKTLAAKFDKDFDKTKVDYQANIIGNKFTNKDKEMQGHFYGPKAAELGGTITNGTNSAAFGAKKSP
ncbi:MAG: transferrin-binding protein-like solute binding protein [Ostreibacterium sp.]